MARGVRRGLVSAADHQGNRFGKNTGLIRPKGGNEGVGEHVRTRFHRQQKALVKLRTFEKDPHRTKKAYFLRFFCRAGFEGADRLPKRDPAV